MSAVQSTMQTLGTKAFDFNLFDVCSQREVLLKHGLGKPVLLMFICNHCPFVVHIAKRMVELANQAQRDGFFVVAINSNDVEAYPQDSPEKMVNFSNKYGFEFPYLFDHSQAVAKGYHAACTPDFFVYDECHKLIYRGQMDGARPANNTPVDGCDLSRALSAALVNLPIIQNQKPSIGCNIKWRKGSEPDYFQRLL